MYMNRQDFHALYADVAQGAASDAEVLARLRIRHAALSDQIKLTRRLGSEVEFATQQTYDTYTSWIAILEAPALPREFNRYIKR